MYTCTSVVLFLQQHRTSKELYMVLDNGTLSFAIDPHEGMAYLVKEGVLEDCSMAYARFIHGTDALHWPSLGMFLEERFVHRQLTIQWFVVYAIHCRTECLS